MNQYPHLSNLFILIQNESPLLIFFSLPHQLNFINLHAQSSGIFQAQYLIFPEKKDQIHKVQKYVSEHTLLAELQNTSPCLYIVHRLCI